MREGSARRATPSIRTPAVSLVKQAIKREQTSSGGGRMDHLPRIVLLHRAVAAAARQLRATLRHLTVCPKIELNNYLVAAAASHANRLSVCPSVFILLYLLYIVNKAL